MDDAKRRFFSGDTLQQALVQAANYFNLDPSYVAYKSLEKRHGFLKTRRKVVIEVDPENPRRESPADLPPAERSVPPPPPSSFLTRAPSASPPPPPAPRPQSSEDRPPRRERERPEGLEGRSRERERGRGEGTATGPGGVGERTVRGASRAAKASVSAGRPPSPAKERRAPRDW